MTTGRPLISIVINNFNYAQFLDECIRSALEQTYPRIEVVVVDDGSTDNSRDIIESHRGAIKYIFLTNSGQGGAINHGFTASSGAWVLFLDSDDKLSPNAAEEIATSIDSELSQIQYLLEVIDESSRSVGVVLPTRPMPTGDVLPQLAKFRYYTSPPASGHAYSRQFLQNVLPMEAQEWRIAADAYLIFAAPFFGKLKSLHKPLAYYRRHGSGASDSQVSDLDSMRAFVNKEWEKEKKREIYLANLFRKNAPGMSLAGYFSPTHIKYMILDYRLSPRRPGEVSLRQMFGQLFICSMRWPSYKAVHRFLFVEWSMLVILLPQYLLIPFVRMTLLPHWRARYGVNSIWQIRVNRSK